MDANITPQVWVLIVPVIVWSLAWKGIALWKAARNGHTAWFVALLVLNTVGILPIIYIGVFSKLKPAGMEAVDTSAAK